MGNRGESLESWFLEFMMAENVIGSVGVWFVPGGSGASEDGRWMEGSGFEEIRGGLEEQDREANPRGRDCMCFASGRDEGARTIEVPHGVGLKKSER